MKNLFKPRITKFLKRTMRLILAAFVLIPAVAYSMPNDFVSANAVGTYETVGVGKKLVDCFPGKDRLLANCVYQAIVGSAKVPYNYRLTEEDVSAIESLDRIFFFVTKDHKSVDISGISNLTNLETFELDFDDESFVMEVTDEIALLTKLTSLGLCGVDSLPKLPSSLTRLYLYNPSPSAFDDLPDSLTSLNIELSDITSLPDNLLNNLPNNLTSLDVSRNKLQSLPDNLPSSLTELWAYGNQLQALPDNLPKSLTSLRAYDNQLQSLPDNLPSSLTELWAYGNQLQSLPDNLPASLTDLYVSFNQLQSLPDNLPASLTYLYVSFNQLKSLPDNLPESLTYLYAENNQFKELDLSNLKNLKNVSVSDQNPQFEYIATGDGNYKILDVPTKNVSDIKINGKAYNDYDNSGSIIVDTLPTSFTYNYDTGYKNVKMDVNGTF